MQRGLQRAGARALAWCAAFGSERGDAAIEMALVFAFLVPVLLFGTGIIGTVAYYEIEVTSAAHVGAMYGMRSATYAANTSGITTAAQGEATDFGTNLNVNPTTFYVCSTAIAGTQYTTQSAASTACTSGHALQFLQVAVTASVTPSIHFTGLPATFTIRGTSVAEVEE